MSNTSTTQIKVSTAEEVHEQLDQAGVRLEAPPDTARLVVRTLRRLAQGRPVPMTDVDGLASDLERAEEAVDFIKQMTEKDDDGNVLGLMGLSLSDHPHDFEVDGQDLHTWCAWDTLFLPPLLGRQRTSSLKIRPQARRFVSRSRPTGSSGPSPRTFWCPS